MWTIDLVDKESGKAVIKRSVYDAVQVGDDESAVRDKLPNGTSILTEGMENEGPREESSPRTVSIVGCHRRRKPCQRAVVRVLTADDEPLIRVGIRAILTSAEGIDVVAEAGGRPRRAASRPGVWRR